MSRFSATLLALLAVAGLTALTAWEAAPRIEADLDARAETLFDEIGVTGGAIRVDGRDVTLRGGLGLEDRDRARAELWRLSGVRNVEDVYVARAPQSEATVLENDSTSRTETPTVLEDDSAPTGQDQLEVSGLSDADVVAAEAALRDALSAGSISFASGTSELTPSSRTILDDVADVLKRYPAVSAEVQGHTDSEGDERTNRRLSQHRADAVAAYLIAAGVPDPALKARGYGESQPIASNEVPDGRARNRRVVFALGLR